MARILETQALDLHMRDSQKARDEKSKAVIMILQKTERTIWQHQVV